MLVTFGKKNTDPRVCNRHMQTLDNTHNIKFRVGAGDCIRKDVAHSQINRLLVKIVCENDETGGEVWSHIENRSERSENTRRRNLTSSL